MILSIAVLGLSGSGCATSVSEATKPVPAAAFVYEPSTASALAFDAPLALGQPLPSFSRDGRALEAFAGYEDQITTLSYTHQRDEIRVFMDHGMLERQAYSDRTSVTTR